MKNSTVLIITIAAAVAMVVGLTIPQIVIFQSASMQPSASGSLYQSPSYGMMGTGVGGGMMGGQSMMAPQTYGNYGSQKMMGGMSMMGTMGYYTSGSGPFPHDAAKTSVNQYLASINNPDLVIDEFEEYSHNFYVAVMERSTGKGAFELIIDRYTGNVQFEPQSMMWNLKYGMGGMMGGSFGANAPTVQGTVTSEEALRIAQDFLNIAYPRTMVGEVMEYPGYYTIMTTLDGRHYGMLSVNRYTGALWYHTWHGMFIAEMD